MMCKGDETHMNPAIEIEATHIDYPGRTARIAHFWRLLGRKRVLSKKMGRKYLLGGRRRGSAICFCAASLCKPYFIARSDWVPRAQRLCLEDAGTYVWEGVAVANSRRRVQCNLHLHLDVSW
jgi:hypothetical protein